jgi:hypothetical protein
MAQKVKNLQFEPRPSAHHVVEDRRWVDQRTEEQRLAVIRQRRKQALLESDWTQARDCPLSVEAQELWALWRQDLRDLPQKHTTAEAAEAAIDAILASTP